MFTTVFRKLIALAILFCPSSLLGQEEQSEAEVLAEFKRFFSKLKTVEERAEALHTLAAADSAPAVTELVKFLAHKTAELDRAAREVLLRYSSPEAIIARQDALLSAKSDAVRTVLIEIMILAEDRSGLPGILEVLREDGKGSVGIRFQSMRAIGRLGDPAAAGEVLSLYLDDKDGLVRMATAESIGLLRIKPLNDRILAKLEDPAWQVVVAAIRSLGRLRSATSIDPLIAHMRKGGRAQEECADALFQITGMDMGLYPDVWAQVMGQLRRNAWRIPTDEELAKKAAARKKYDALYSAQEGGPAFAGIKTASRRLLFIIDISGSMEDQVVEIENFDAGYPDRQKLSIVKVELERAIENLDSGTRFNIVAFASDLMPWKKSLVPANVVNRASATSWIGRLQAKGGSEAQSLAAAGLSGSANLAAGKTNTYKALMHAFDFDPDKQRGSAGNDHRKILKNPVDTVFFLSDGRPSTGKIVDQAEILEEVRRRNLRYQLVINCVAIGEFQKAFLKSLAEITGGVFVDLGQ